MLQWTEVLITSDGLTDTVTNAAFGYEISRIIYVNEQPTDWATKSITQDRDTETLDFTAVGGFSGRLILSYKSTGISATGVTNQTNAYDIDAILPYLRRHGWKNPTTDDYNIVNSANQQTSSGRYFNDNSFHAMSQIEYLYDCQPDSGQSSTEFNTYLEMLEDSNISSMLNYVFDTPQFVESGLLYDKVEHTRLETVANSGKFVAVRFKLSKYDYFMHLLNVALLFDSDVTFTLYLYNEFRGKVAEWEVSPQANIQTIVDISEAIRYNDASSKGGMWFLGYFQDDLGDAKALRYTACWNDTKTFGAQCISSTVTGAEAFDMQEYSYTHDTFGINVEYSVTQDITQLIRRNSYLFDNLQGLMMAAVIMEICLTTPRSNRNQRITDEVFNLMYRELNNVVTSENPTEAGLKSKIRKEIKKVKNAFFNQPASQVVSLS